MSTKHTPGPWTALEHSWSDTGIVAGDEYICLLQIRNSSEADEEARSAKMAANADLIAAAPDLLAVALEALHVIRVIKPPENGNGTIVRLEDAILKATGEKA